MTEAALPQLLDHAPSLREEVMRLDEDKDESILFCQETLPRPEPHLFARRVSARLRYHHYGGTAPVEMLDLAADRESLASIGLVILAVLFHEDLDRVRIDLDPASGPFAKETHTRVSPGGLQHLILQFESPNPAKPRIGEFVEAPSYLSYAPTVAEPHPLGSLRNEEQPLLPHIYLTDLGLEHTRETQRNTIVGFGGSAGSAHMAASLLDIGRSERDEYAYENPQGFGGVGWSSAELLIWLPGSFGWPEGE